MFFLCNKSTVNLTIAAGKIFFALTIVLTDLEVKYFSLTHRISLKSLKNWIYFEISRLLHNGLSYLFETDALSNMSTAFRVRITRWKFWKTLISKFHKRIGFHLTNSCLVFEQWPSKMILVIFTYFKIFTLID